MSRQPSSSKYKISSPQPYIPPNPQEGGYHTSNSGPSSSRPDARPPPSGSPARPARSRMRDQPASRRDLAPIHTADSLRSPEIPSPLSPMATSSNGHGETQVFSDPFAADRSQRSELRAQAQAATQQTPPNVGGATLRNVVGAFMSASKSKSEPAKRPAKSRARTETLDDWQVSEGGKFAEIDQVLQTIRKDYPFVLESDFSPSTLALSLLSQTAPTLSHPPLPSFLQVHDALSTALQAAVQAHFQSFAASLPAHANFLAALRRAQQQVKSSKETLREAREGFGGKGKAELAGVRARERQVRDMLQILDTIDNLKQVPDKLEGLIGDKKFLQAAVLLVSSAKTVNKPEIAVVGAVSELRAYFVSQETTLTEILVEELHSHLYLKTFNSDTRWHAYTPGQTSLPVDEPETVTSRLSRYLASLAERPSDRPEYASDAPSVERRASGTLGPSASTQSLFTYALSDLPETDSYRYIETVLESLGVLGQLGPALDVVSQRVAGEIHALVENTLDEVEERAERAEESVTAKPHHVSSLEISVSPRHSAILRDLIWTLYSKLAAVLEGHRVVYEVSRWISARRDFKHSVDSTFAIPVLEVWKPIQQEVRTLLQNYLTDDSQGSALDRRSAMPINEILRDSKIARDRQKPMFRFADTDMRAILADVKPIDELIQKTLRASVPGLITGEALNPLDEAFSANGRHRNLIPPHAFNVTTLFQPTISFIERAASMAPAGFEEEPKAYGAVLEDFVVRVFLPQLDERVTASFQNAVSGYDAYQLDLGVKDTDKPPLKSSVRVMALIHSLCQMLETAPFHRENYSRLVVGVIVQYYQQCSTRFKELVSQTAVINSASALPAAWAQREDVIACLTDIRAVAPADHNENLLVGQRELKLETDLLAGQSVIESQLIRSSRKLEALCNLSQSLRWMIDALLDLQDVADEAQELEAPTQIPAHVDSTPRLPLTRAMAQRYEAIIQTYEQLAEMVLNTIRLEVRCRVMCNLAVRKGDIRLESEALEPDPDVVDLAGHLTDTDDLTHRALSLQDQQFVFRGLGQLVDHMFIHAARSVTVINLAGVQKIKRNILSLQQTLRAIQGTDDGILSRSIQFWDMYEKGPKDMLETLRTSKPIFTFDDYNTMLNLQCKADKSDAPSSELNTYLIDLHALSMSIEGWEIGEG